MATYSRAELRNAVLYDLHVIDARTPASAEEAVLADDRIQQTLEGLSQDGLIPFDLDADAIPAPYFVPVSRVAAATLAVTFGKDVALYEGLSKLGMRELRRLKARPHYGSAAPATYY